jgi:hypothetical protein
MGRGLMGFGEKIGGGWVKEGRRAQRCVMSALWIRSQAFKLINWFSSAQEKGGRGWVIFYFTKMIVCKA